MKYADAGVNIAVADDAKQRIRHLASKTFSPAVLGGIGGFGALFALDRKAMERAGAGVERGRRGNQAENCDGDGCALHGGRRPGQPLRE